jgi:DUTP diphosphatase|nr:MAG TPA: deoxyuridine 5'-triphosphate nucleotidohydrolase [Caudoviricetes sp.]
MKFEKVSFEAFRKDIKKFYDDAMSEDEIKASYDRIQIPKRSTKFAAGYDFVTPIYAYINSAEPTMVPTGIKIDLNPENYLQIVQRSSSTKYGYYLANSVGVIDKDYYNNESNEGDIILALRAYPKVYSPKKYDYDKDYKILSIRSTDSSIDGVTVMIKPGNKVAQGIILSYYVVEDDSANETRKGGFGSTGH